MKYFAGYDFPKIIHCWELLGRFFLGFKVKEIQNFWLDHEIDAITQTFALVFILFVNGILDNCSVFIGSVELTAVALLE